MQKSTAMKYQYFCNYGSYQVYSCSHGDLQDLWHIYETGPMASSTTILLKVQAVELSDICTILSHDKAWREANDLYID